MRGHGEIDRDRNMDRTALQFQIFLILCFFSIAIILAGSCLPVKKTEKMSQKITESGIILEFVGSQRNSFQVMIP